MCRRPGDRLMTEEQGKMLNELSSILMEMTKLPEVNVALDAGAGLMRVSRVMGKPESFYRSVYVIGDRIVLRRIPNSNSVVVGAPVGEVMAMGTHDEGRSASCTGVVDTIRVKYSLVCREIEASVGRRVQPESVGEAIRRMAR